VFVKVFGILSIILIFEFVRDREVIEMAIETLHKRQRQRRRERRRRQRRRERRRKGMEKNDVKEDILLPHKDRFHIE
jgi:hypothetical protein